METIVIKELLCSFIYGCIGGFVIVLPYIIYVQFKNRRRLNKWSEYAEIKNVEIEQALKSFNQRIMAKGDVWSDYSYIEVLVKDDEIDYLILAPGMCDKMYIGEKIVIDQGFIRLPGYMNEVFSESTIKRFIEQEERYYSSSNLLFILITDKIHHDNYIGFQGKVVPEDGVFYSN